jgi:MFS family permease
MTTHSTQTSLPVWLTLLFATACGLIVANIYYAQPLIGPITASLGLSRQAAGLIVTMGQIGYGVGLLLVVPLADLFENKRLILYCLGLCVAALICAGLSTQAVPFLVAALFIGLGSCAVQMYCALRGSFNAGSHAWAGERQCDERVDVRHYASQTGGQFFNAT